jgi:hypothetical protein
VARPVPQCRTTFDLDHLATLASSPGFNLWVSARTLYILQNLAAADVADPYRYAEKYYPNGSYDSVADDPTREADFIDICDLVQEEVYPTMGQPYTSVINEIEEEVVVTGDTLNMYVFVPAGETWELLALACNKEGPAGDIRVHLRKADGTLCAELFYETQGSGKAGWVKWQGRVLLGPEESFRIRFYGCTPTEKCSVAYCVGVMQ